MRLYTPNARLTAGGWAGAWKVFSGYPAVVQTELNIGPELKSRAHWASAKQTSMFRRTNCVSRRLGRKHSLFLNS
jgi:hypothetical protein